MIKKNKSPLTIAAPFLHCFSMRGELVQIPAWRGRQNAAAHPYPYLHLESGRHGSGATWRVPSIKAAPSHEMRRAGRVVGEWFKDAYVSTEPLMERRRFCKD